MSTTIPTPPDMPDPPQRKDDQTLFWQRCDAWVKAMYDLGVYLKTFVTATAAVVAEMTGLRDNAAASAATAQAQASEATTQAGNALSYALASQAAQVATPAWSPVTVYSYPQTAVGSNGHTYRCTGQNVVGADPTTSGAVWVDITPSLNRVKLYYLTQG